MLSQKISIQPDTSTPQERHQLKITRFFNSVGAVIGKIHAFTQLDQLIINCIQ